MKKLVIFGAAAFARLARHYFATDSDYDVVAFSVDRDYLAEPELDGLPVVAFEDLIDVFPPSECDMFVAVGHQKVNTQREAKVAAADAAGYHLASLISSKAQHGDDLRVGPNSIVMEYALLQPRVTVGKNAIVWSNTRLAFGVAVGDHCWLVSAIVGESVELGDNTFVGLNATVGPKICVGKSNVIGAGALVLHDTPDNAVLRGVESQVSKVPSHRLPAF